MRLIFIGSGSAFTVGDNNFQSNMLLEDSKGQRLLIDCGSDARLALNELGLSYKDIDAVYLSHIHADHVGGLEWLALTTYFDPQCKKPDLYLSQSLQQPLWNNVLKGGLRSILKKNIDLSTYFKVHAIGKKNQFKWQKTNFQIVKTEHTYFYHKLLPSYGLFFKIGQQNIFLTTDTKFTPTRFFPWYEKADIIFHDCETAAKKTNVHPSYQDLTTLPAKIKNKTWLYDYNPGPLPDAKKAGFLGFVQKGQVFNFS